MLIFLERGGGGGGGGGEEILWYILHWEYFELIFLPNNNIFDSFSLKIFANNILDKAWKGKKKKKMLDM